MATTHRMPPEQGPPVAPEARPATSPWQGSEGPAEIERSRLKRRLVGRIAMVMLLAGAMVVSLTALPIAVRLIQGSAPEAAHRGIAHAMWEKGYAVGPPAPREASTYAPKPSEYGSGHEGLALLEQLLEEAQQQQDEGSEPKAEQDSTEQLGAVATRDLVLLDRADPSADVAFQVPKGQVMLIMKDTGRWLLVAVRLPDRIKLGWTTRDQLTIVR
jgi:hypothetical protein